MKKRIIIRRSTIISSLRGHAIAQVVSRWFLSAEARFRFQANPCGICNGQSGRGTDLFSSTSMFPVMLFREGYILTNLLPPRYLSNWQCCRSQWPRGLRRRSAATHLLRLCVGIPPGVWMSVCCECCVLSGRGLCDELITRPEGSYRLWSVVVCDLETSWMRRPLPIVGLLH